MSDELDVYFDKLIKACRKPKCCVIDINCCIKNSSFIEKALKNKDFLNKKRKYLTEATNPKQKDEEYIHKIKELLLRKGYKYKEEHSKNEIVLFFMISHIVFFVTTHRNNYTLIRFKKGNIIEKEGKKFINITTTKTDSSEIIQELDLIIKKLLPSENIY